MQELPKGNIEQSGVDGLVAHFPDLYHAINRMLEDCTGPSVPKKAGIVLWLISNSAVTDESGPYVLVKDIVEKIGDWLALSLPNARSEVSKVKAMLMQAGYIVIAGGNNRVHLTAKGSARVQEMRSIAKRTIEEALAALSPFEQELLMNFVDRLMMQEKPPVEVDERGAETMPRKLPARVEVRRMGPERAEAPWLDEDASTG